MRIPMEQSSSVNAFSKISTDLHPSSSEVETHTWIVQLMATMQDAQGSLLPVLIDPLLDAKTYAFAQSIPHLVIRHAAWGAADVEGEAALVFYGFTDDVTLEIVFPETVTVGANRNVQAWDMLLSMEPNAWFLAGSDGHVAPQLLFYVEGETPDLFMSSLETFFDRLLALDLSHDATIDPSTKTIRDYLLDDGRAQSCQWIPPQH